jgi:hypothetical protein
MAANGWRFEFSEFGFLSEVRDPEGRTRLRSPEHAGPWDGINDGKNGGAGAFGVHVIELGATRHLDTCHRPDDPGRDGWGFIMDTPFVSQGRRIFTGTGYTPIGGAALRTRAEWRIDLSQARATLDFRVELLRDLWIKEPKLGVNGLLGIDSAYVLSAEGVVLGRHDLSGYSDPSRHTRQATNPLRRHVHLLGDRQGALLRFGGFNGHSLVGPGWGDWRRLADSRPGAHPVQAKYCHCDRLRDSWEMVRWGSRHSVTGVMFHGWTGGAGQHDCLCAYRRLDRGMRARLQLRIAFT